ncbi:MAG: tRNA (adenosine(37)-N6)-dimethylallyltransferase MiaA [Candidatus Marinamargulisbacteria bacterium]
MSKTMVIIGPTASGKSEFSISKAKKLNASIISADAVQVYKEFNIGSGKLSKQEMQGIPHHLIDHVSPMETYTVQQFINDATTLINRKDTPKIICGGSAMYLRALLYGYQPLKRLPESERPEGTIDELWQQLNIIDPELAKKTPKQNKQRVQRYLELNEIYKQPPSSLFKATPFDKEKYQVFGLSIEKQTLKERINVRVDTMIRNGLVDEVKYLMEKYDITQPAFKAIGYKEPIAFLDGKINKEKMINLIKTNSHNYAKRQMTWFRKFDNVQWIEK